MRHWACALSARLTSRSERVFPERMPANERMKTRSSAIACAARSSAIAVTCGSFSIGSNSVSPFQVGLYIVLFLLQ